MHKMCHALHQIFTRLASSARVSAQVRGKRAVPGSRIVGARGEDAREQVQERALLRVWGNDERAIRSHRAVGRIKEGRLRDHARSAGRHHDLVLMGILRGEWRAAQAR